MRTCPLIRGSGFVKVLTSKPFEYEGIRLTRGLGARRRGLTSNTNSHLLRIKITFGFFLSRCSQDGFGFTPLQCQVVPSNCKKRGNDSDWNYSRLNQGAVRGR